MQKILLRRVSNNQTICQPDIFFYVQNIVGSHGDEGAWEEVVPEVSEETHLFL